MAKKTYDECYEIAKKYNTKKSFRENERYTYSLASRNGWLKDYHWLDGHEKYSYEECKNIAEGYKSKQDFKRLSPQIYAYCRYKKWLNDFSWLAKEDKKTFTYEKCYLAAKKYNSVKDLKRENKPVYVAALRYKWLKDYTWLTYANNSYTYDVCFNEARKYETTKEFAHFSGPIFHKAKRSGWINDYTWITDNTSHHINEEDITYEKCMEAAKKYFSRTEMQNGSRAFYLVAKKNGWFKDYVWFMGNDKWGKETFLIYSYEDPENKRVYVGLTKDLKRRRRQHMRKHPKTHEYDVVKSYFNSLNKELPQEKILEEYLTPAKAQEREGYWLQKYILEGWTGLNIAKTGKEVSSVGNYAIKWTKEKCLSEAKACKTLEAFIKQHNGAYQASVRNNWLVDFDWLERQDGKNFVKKKRNF